MKNTTKSVTSNYTITGIIQGSQVNISYSQTGTASPTQINASCTILNTGTSSVTPSPMMMPGMPGMNNDNTNINMTMYPDGQKQSSVNGKLTMTEVSSVLTEIETELNAIFSQFP